MPKMVQYVVMDVPTVRDVLVARLYSIINMAQGPSNVGSVIRAASRNRITPRRYGMPEES